MANDANSAVMNRQAFTADEIKKRHDLWKEFQDEWPVDRVRAMTLDEYTNLDRDDSFTYSVEARYGDLGSIWGSNSFKFGIFHQKHPKARAAGRFSSAGEYAWRTPMGKNAAEAFERVRALVVAVAEQAQAKNFETIEANPLQSIYKWKLAFLYQDRESPFEVFPIYAERPLMALYKKWIDQSARSRDTPVYVRYDSLRDRFKDVADPFELSQRLWLDYNSGAAQEAARAWALDLGVACGGEKAALALITQRSVGNDRVPERAAEWIDAEDQAEKDDRIAFVIGGRVRARGTLTGAEESTAAWSQELCDVAWAGPTLGEALVRIPDALARSIWGEGPLPLEPVAVEQAPLPRNLVLYGPPGTGKTFATIRRALRLALGDATVATMSPETAAKEFRRLQNEGRIEMVTFHQSYGYEEFVEGLRPVLGEAGSGDVRYEVYAGALKRLALRAAGAGLRNQRAEPTFDELWAELQRRYRAEGGREGASQRATYLIRATARENFDAERLPDEEDQVVTERKQNVSKAVLRIMWDNQKDLGPPEQLGYDKVRRILERARGGTGGHHYSPTAIIYREMFALRNELVASQGEAAVPITLVQHALDSSASGKAEFAFSPRTPQYVLIIDEINRGNVSKVLGELITLLEPDKRLGTPNELKLPLAYSPEHKFAVPPNLHIVATMNTADRSIALMDVALRRRFEFEEVMPDAGALRGVVLQRTNDPVLAELVVDLLETMNARIRFLYDRDHQIGHAYFMTVTDLESLRRILVDRIVPLLREYFYGRWDKVATVVGCPYDESGRALRPAPVADGGRYRAAIVETKVASAREVLGFESDEHEGQIEPRLARALVEEGTKARDLVPYFLGVLELDPAARTARESRLLAAMDA